MLEQMHHAFTKAIESVKTSDELESLKVKYLGRNGLLKQQYLLLCRVCDVNEKKALGKSINDLKTYIDSSLSKKKNDIKESLLLKKISEKKVDVTLPEYPFSLGKVHVISAVIEKIKRIFSTFGFKEVKGPEIEDEYHVFDALNTPKHHPAREMQDSFYLPNNLMLRPHTSSVQVRAMESGKPPFKIISIGKVYRRDWDSLHTPMFHQIEGLCIDEGISIANLKYYIKSLLESFFEHKVIYRLRPSFFPFTEPSMEVDVFFDKNRWIEILGCGMVHKNVLKLIEHGSDDKKAFTGFAFGIGIERLTMLLNKFSDIRKFYDGDIQWLSKNCNNML